MGLRNIIAKRDQVENSQGNPLAGGIVYLYEPGTTTFIQSFQDSGLVAPHTAPVRLSGSGRANIWINRDCDLRIEDRNGNLILTEDSVNPDSLGASEIGGLISNGGFEIDTDGDGTPDSWALLNDAGSTNARDTSESTEGLASFRFTSSGTGGGSLTTDSFFPVNDVDLLRLSFDLRSTVAGVRNIFRVEWYDVSQVSISDTDVYDSTANPVTFTSFDLSATPPALARFAKVKLIGIDPSVALAGSTYFDRVSAFYPATVSGIFDNIEIRDNEIITTNTNGELALKPDGLGPVNIFSGGAVDLTDVQNPLNISTVIDPAVSPHLAFDEDQIQAKADATNAAILNINPLGGNVLVGGSTVAAPLLAVNSTAAGDPSIELQQAGVTKAFLQYLDTGDIFAIDSDGTLVLATANTAALSIDTSQNVSLAASLYLPEVAAGGDVANFGQIYVNASNELIYRDEGGTETNIAATASAGGADTQMQYNNGGAFGGIADFTHDDGAVASPEFQMFASSALVAGDVFRITSNVSAKTGQLVQIIQDHASSVAHALLIRNDGTGDGIQAIAANAGGRAGYFYSNVASRTVPLVFIENDSASGSGVALEIQQDQNAPHIQLSGGNGTGILFPVTQNASNDANTLDDYQEGEFTATLTASSGSITLNSAADTLAYVKIGRLVHLQGRLLVASVSTPSGSVSLDGLPLALTPDTLTDFADQPTGHVQIENLSGGVETPAFGLRFDPGDDTPVFTQDNGDSNIGGDVQSLSVFSICCTYLAAN